jgi:hypothetical protein
MRFLVDLDRIRTENSGRLATVHTDLLPVPAYLRHAEIAHGLDNLEPPDRR